MTTDVVKSWLETEAAHLSKLEPSAPLEDLDFLAEVVGDARIVGWEKALMESTSSIWRAPASFVSWLKSWDFVPTSWSQAGARVLPSMNGYTAVRVILSIFKEAASPMEWGYARR